MALTAVQSFKNNLNNQNKHSKNMKIQAFSSFKINHITLYIKTDRNIPINNRDKKNLQNLMEHFKCLVRRHG